MNDELLIKFLLRETTPGEGALVKDWIEADPDNQKHFSQIETIWNTSKNLIPESSIDTDRAWERFKARRDSKESQQEAIIRPMAARFNWMKVAAVFLIAALGAWSVYSVLKPDYNTLTAAADVMRGTLPDGSGVTLNKNSSISFPEAFEDDQRLVKLDSGEVFFDVKADKSRPFVINADDVTVAVVGTSFNVRHDKTETEVIVETGIVEVTKAGETISLSAGEKVRISGNSKKLIKERTSDNLHNYFRSKKFVANNTPLWRVVEVLNDAYDVQIRIEDPRLRDLRLTTTFQEESLDTILKVIAETFEIRFEKRGQHIVLK